jgi:hypothetical protein
MEITDQDRQERWATQADIEEREVGAMVAGANVYRRARGEDDLTVGDAQRAATERQRESIARTGSQEPSGSVPRRTAVEPPADEDQR